MTEESIINPNDSVRHSMSPPAAPASSAELKHQADLYEEKVKEFSRNLGATVILNSQTSKDVESSEALAAIFADAIGEEEVVLTIPTLDVKLSGEKGTQEGLNAATSSALPGIGESRAKVGLGSNFNNNNRPNMAASVLTAASNEAASLEQRAAHNMSKQTSWTKSTLSQASLAIATNAAEFFSHLIDSRLKSWTLLLLRHSLSTGEHDSRSRLLRMLTASIKVSKSETRFKTLQLPSSAAGQAKEADVILPLIFEVTLDLSVQEKAETVTVRAPGTVSAHVADQEAKFTKILVSLDTGLLLNSMVDQARILVIKAVATATKTPIPPVNPPNTMAASAITATASPKDTTKVPFSTSNAPVFQTSNLTGFRSSLNFSQPTPSSQNEGQEAPGLQKAKSSALRLTSILYGKGETKNQSLIERAQSTLGMRRIRSVKWDTPAEIPKISLAPGAAPSLKKQRMVQNACKIKSFKSFGRPHGGDFGSGPRNATFAAFGGSEGGGRTQLWGRDGRLALHPVPMQTSGGVQADRMGLTGVADKNATFEMSKLLLNRQQPAVAGVGFGDQTPSLPRSTTAIENWLVNKSTGRQLS